MKGLGGVRELLALRGSSDGGVRNNGNNYEDDEKEPEVMPQEEPGKRGDEETLRAFLSGSK